MRIIDRKSKLVGNEFIVELLINICGETQYHYVSTSRSMSSYERDIAVQEYLARNVKLRNLSDEEQANHVIAFKGGAR